MTAAEALAALTETSVSGGTQNDDDINPRVS